MVSRKGELCRLDIESIDLDAQGVAHHEGKVIFVQGALAGERVNARITRRKPSFDKAVVEQVLKPSSLRVIPECPHFGVCGGCAMQHIDERAQVAIKQRALEDAFIHIGKLRPLQVLPAIYGPGFGYRYRARLSVRYVAKKGGVLVGFHERHSSYVADMQQCLILPAHVSALLLPLRRLVAGLSRPERIPQIEVAVGEQATVLCLRHLEPLNAADKNLLSDFADLHDIHWWLQPKGPDSAYPLKAASADVLFYALPEFGLRMHYQPADFTQVNPFINRCLVSQALRLLQLQPGDRVADLFCGLGNFSLPMAASGARVVGVEGSAALVERAADAADKHGLADRIEFLMQDLFAVDQTWLRQLGSFERMLIDPPREGALAIAQALAALAPAERPKKLVYVSCNPATLARDAALLQHVGGWTLSAAGVVNMFPHTAHVESIAVFEP